MTDSDKDRAWVRIQVLTNHIRDLMVERGEVAGQDVVKFTADNRFIALDASMWASTPDLAVQRALKALGRIST